jgi:hypothetical protein
VTAVALAGLTGLSACGSTVTPPRPAPATTPVPGLATTPTEQPSALRSGSAQVSREARIRRRADVALHALIRKDSTQRISVAAVDLSNGISIAAGRSAGLWTASAYKLFVVEALLLNRQGGDGLGLSSLEIAECTRAIENSDNIAGYALFLDAGGNVALQHTADLLHMKHTDFDETDPTFTRTSAADYLRLLRALIDPDSPLHPDSRKFVLGLMSQVEADQRWGVGTVADRGTTFYNKNGWLSVDDSNAPGDNNDDRWITSSVGIVTAHSQRLLVSVFTEGNATFEAGVDLVQALTRQLTSYVTGTVIRSPSSRPGGRR